MKFLKKTILALAALAALSLPAKAEEPIKLGINLIAQREKPLLTQTFVGYDKNKALFEQTPKSQNYGLNLEYNGLRLNLGLKDQEKDQSRIALDYTTDLGFLGLEYQILQDKEDKFRGSFIGGIKPCDLFSLEATIDTELNSRAILFIDPTKDSRFGIGGGVSKDEITEKLDPWEINAVYSQKITERLGIRPYIRIGSDDFLETKLGIGQKVKPKSALIFGVKDTFFNNISLVGDITSPLFFNGFSYVGADGILGDETFDVSFDAKYSQKNGNKKGYANVAVNLGDYWKFEDVTLSPEVHRDFTKEISGFRIGASTELEKTGFKLWYQGTFDEKAKPDHAFFIGFQKEF